MAALFRVVLIVLLGSLVGGCGGGGGGGGSSTKITLSPSSVQFSARSGGALPASKSVTIGVTDPNAVYVLVGYPPSTDVPDWLDLALPTAETLTLSVVDTDRPPGSYSTTVRVGVLDAAENLMGYEDLPVRYSVVDFGPDQDALAFSYAEGAATLPAAQTLNILGNGEAWTTTADRAWVHLDRTSGNAPNAIAVSVDPTGLPPGNHTATLTVTNTTNATTSRVSVSLAITAANLTAIPNLSFAGINGATLAQQQVSLALDNGDTMTWSASKNASWISIDASSGTTPALLNISVDPWAAHLASGTYTGTVTVSGQYHGRTLTRTATVSLHLTQPTFVTDQASVLLGGSTGTSTAAASLNVSLNTGSNAYPWTATLDSGTGLNWLHLSSASGSVSATPAALSVSADRSGLSNGVYSGSILFSATVNGDTITKSVPVTLNFVINELVVSRDGFGFVDTPSMNVTTASVDVSDAYGSSSTPWTAVSDQTWLTVTPNGLTGDVLDLTADVASLTTNQVHYATVTLSSSETANSPVIKIGLWKDESDPTTPFSSAVTYRSVVTDPIRPYAYLHNLGTDITVVNVYTGGTVATFPSVATALGDMAMNSDGSELFAVDTVNQEIVVVNPVNGAVLRTIDLSSGSSPRLAFARPDGHPILIAGDGHAYDIAGVSRGSHGLAGRLLAASRDGNHTCGATTGTTTSTLTCYDLAYDRLADGVVFANGRVRYASGFAKDVAVDSTCSRVYLASGSPSTFSVFRGSDLVLTSSLPAGAYPNTVEVGPDDTLVGAAASYYGPTDLWFYSANGTSLGSMYLSGYGRAIHDGQVKISGDGVRAIVLTDDPAMKIITLP